MRGPYGPRIVVLGVMIGIAARAFLARMIATVTDRFDTQCGQAG